MLSDTISNKYGHISESKHAVFLFDLGMMIFVKSTLIRSA